MNRKYNLYPNLILLCAMLFASGNLFAQLDPIKVQVKNEQAVNTDGLEFSPTFFEDGVVLISTNNAGLKKETDKTLKLSAMSILRSRRNTEGALQAAEPFSKELTSEFHEGPVCFDRTGETVYFSRNVIINGKVKVDKDGRQRQRLYMSKKSGEAWSDPQPLPFNTNEFDDCHPAISIDGDKMYFASNRPGGQGGMDIYVSYRTGESWGEPVNLGATVNTKGNEVFPFVHADNTLYFASSSHDGNKGGFDIYMTTPKEGNDWNKPQNLGTPFNTSGDDFGLIVDLDKINGYYSSNGAGGAGGDEIFSFHVDGGNLDQYLQQVNNPKQQYAMKLLVVDKLSGKPLEEASIRIISAEGGNVIGRDENGNLITITKENGVDVMKSVPQDKGMEGITDYNGSFESDLPEGNYVVNVNKDGYQGKQTTVSVSKVKRLVKIELEKGHIAGKARWNATLNNYATNAPLAGAKVILTHPNTGKKDTVYADANGLVDAYLDPNVKYRMDIVQGGRVIGSSEVNTHGWNTTGKPNAQNFSVAPMMPGSAIQLPNIYYNFNDATLRPDARKDLSMVISLMKQQPSLTIELGSHTDSRGSDRYNKELSQRRANGVTDYLTSKGVDRNRLKPVGYGESEPRNKCVDGATCLEQDHARNRRTEIRVLAGMQGSSVVYVDGQIGNVEDDPAPQSAETVNVTPLNPGKNKGNTKKTGKTPDKASGKETPTQEPAANTAEGNFYLVCGSFLMENRAESRLNELQQAGYQDAFITRFPNSTYYSVCVGKYETRKEADAARRNLVAEKNVDAFVKAIQ